LKVSDNAGLTGALINKENLKKEPKEALSWKGLTRQLRIIICARSVAWLERVTSESSAESALSGKGDKASLEPMS
jgi:hypothetical protein